MQKKKVQKKKKCSLVWGLDDAWLFHFEARRTREASVEVKELLRRPDLPPLIKGRADGIMWKMMTSEEDQRRL